MTNDLKLAIINFASKTLDYSRVEYIKRNMEDAILTSAGFVISCKIQLQECFSFCCNHNNNEDYNEATKMAYNTKTNPAYFINYNIKFYNEIIGFLEKKNAYFISSYFDCPDAPFVDIINEDVAKLCRDDEYFIKHPVKISKCNEEETEMLLKFFKNIKSKQEKRCLNYIKKYGMSKINAYVY